MPPAHGSPSCLRYFGVSAQPQIDLQGDPRSSSFTEQRQSFRVTCFTTLHELNSSPKPKQSKQGKTEWTSRGGARDGTDSLNHLSTRPAALSRATRQESYIPSRRPGAPSGSAETSQVGSRLGRTLHHLQGAEQRSISTLQPRQGNRRAASMERRSPEALLHVTADGGNVKNKYR